MLYAAGPPAAGPLAPAWKPLPIGTQAWCVRKELATDIPFGMFSGSTYREQELQLEPRDRLVVITDGLLERSAVAHFDVLTAVAETAALHPREVVHAFKASVLAATGAELADDAAVLCIDWHGSARCRPRGAARAER